MKKIMILISVIFLMCTGIWFRFHTKECRVVSDLAYDKNKKGENKVMFQGTSADVESSIWAMEKTAIETSKKERETDYSKYHRTSSIGSDEVGTGDYFGPIVVTSCYVNINDVDKLDKLGIRDSKK